MRPSWSLHWSLWTVLPEGLNGPFPIHVEPLTRPLRLMTARVVLQVLLQIFQGYTVLLSTLDTQVLLNKRQVVPFHEQFAPRSTDSDGADSPRKSIVSGKCTRAECRKSESLREL